ncbi:MAG: DNA repair protein RadC [Bacteroidales bacterium]|jgi:DNA repair protein RadC|nr:DNA repair protein RadC [Bacteroidales bacterium]
MSPQTFTIKDWSKDDRPREKLLTKGVAALSNAELLAVILGSGSQDENAVELARRILAQSGNSLDELGRRTVAELKNNKGVGEAKAVGIIAAMELGRRRNSGIITEKKKIANSGDIFMLFQPMLYDLPHEEFWLLFLNNANRMLAMHRLSLGGMSETSVDIRLIMKLCLERFAAGLVLCHNHPSGNRQPGNHDMLVTKKIKEGGKMLDITLVDHVIIAGANYYSFADEGVL